MIRGAGHDIGRVYTEDPAVFEKSFGIFDRIFLQANSLFPGVLDGFVVHVGDIHDVNDAVVAVAQIPAQQVLEYKGAEIAHMSVIVYGGAARIKPYDTLFHRVEFLFSAG